jgi:hypothetical protein
MSNLRVNHAYKQTRFVERIGHRQMVSARALHINFCLADQIPQRFRKFAEFSAGVADVVRRRHNFSKGTYDCHRALLFGTVNTHCVHKKLPLIEFCNWQATFTHCRFNLLGDTNARFSLL